MATTVAQHTVATFTSPVNGTTPIDANTVRGNDNTIRSSYNDHDSDPGIHVQSSTLASRPAAGTAGRKWITADTGEYKLWYDDGTRWNEVGNDAVDISFIADGNIVKGDVLKLTGWNNGQNLPTLGPATVSGDVCFAIATEAVNNGDRSFAINTGFIEDVNTSAFSTGDILYPSNAAGPGSITSWFQNTKPTSGNYQMAAYVIRDNASNGVLFVEFTGPRIVERSDNTASTVVLRDASGDFSAGTVTVGALTSTGLVTFASLKGTGATTVTNILDEDNMASDSATALATQQSIKAYVDSQVGTVDTLAEILANGNTSGGTNLIMSAGDTLTVDTIAETTAGAGVTIDSVLLKDDVVNATDVETGTVSANDGTLAITVANSTGALTLASALADSNLATISSAGKVANSATTADSANTASAIVARDGSGNFSAGTITAALTGNADTATKLSSSRTFALTGDVTGSVSSDLTSGASISTSIAAGAIVDADINAGAAISLSKLATGALPTGITVASANIVDGTIVDADISASAEIAVSKLANGSNRQLLQTSGTDVEWTSNVDVPGTLDVTGATTLDSTLTVTGDANFDSGTLFVDESTNRVGIGSTSPSAPLHIETAATGSNLNALVLRNPSTAVGGGVILRLESLAGGVTTLSQIVGTSEGSNSSALLFYTESSGTGAERMRIDSSGNVGIGTTPSVRLHVVSSASEIIRAKSTGAYGNIVADNTGATGGGIFTAKQDGAQIGIIGVTGGYKGNTESNCGIFAETGKQIEFATNGSVTPKVVIDSSGNVGIGNTNPNFPLDVASDSGTNGIKIRGRNNAGVDEGSLAFMKNDGTTTQGYIQSDNTNLGIYAITDLKLGGGNSVDMTITSAGNVLVGTTSPAVTAGRVHASSNGGFAPPALVADNGSTSALRIVFNGSTYASVPAAVPWLHSYQNIYLGSDASNSVIFVASGSENARIDADGLKFNGDTAAANALDDYEEGTWTATMTPGTSGTITLQATGDDGVYTKIGRVVTVQGMFFVGSVSNPVGTRVDISLPFSTDNLALYSGRGSGSMTRVVAGTRTVLPVTFSEASSYVSVWLDASTVSASDEYTLSLTYYA